ncbi:MAG: diacylglycerol kinase family lipid kinase [Clostridia bacterium]|nr:diacylglycerol kinase family lipid kinase [Clostridia bacterium]MBR6565079.1 diacylglycerol kinase family lipid kinase [Clostridia bacterium]
MLQKRLLLIVNPLAGQAKMNTKLLKVVEIFSSADYSVTVYPTKAKGDATNHCLTLSDNDYDIIVVCGGDGTLNEVITGIMQKGLNIPLGYIPAGTLNEWSSGLKISRNIEIAAKDILTGQRIRLDIGKFGDKYFSYTSSFGAFTSASYSAPQDVKNVLGQAAYFFEGIKSLAAIKPIRLKCSYEQGEIEGEFLFGAISNSMSVGGIVKYDKSAVELNDGQFEVLLIRNPDNLLKLQPIIDGILKHEFDREGIVFFKTQKLSIETEESLSWTLDGEFAETNGEIGISNVHNAITFIVP